MLVQKQHLLLEDVLILLKLKALISLLVKLRRPLLWLLAEKELLLIPTSASRGIFLANIADSHKF